jgi:hypothetical protein
MPCGGIFPFEASGICWQCRLPESTHFCEEWDCYLHEGCINSFLESPEGKIVLSHGHEIIRSY